jgi:long-chain acyl-CoA synthetase
MFYFVCDRYKDTRRAYGTKVDGKWEFLNHEQLRDEVECFALGLLNLGVKKGDRIGLVSENRIEWVVADLAIASIGAVSVPLFPTLTPKQEEYIFNNCGASAVIVSNNFQLKKILEVNKNIPTLRHIIVINNDFQEDDVNIKNMQGVLATGCDIRPREQRRNIIMEHAAKVEADDLLTIIYTSGTTGDPKGVMLTHKNVISNVKDSREAVQFKEQDIFLSFLPLCHSYERTTGYYSAFSIGATIYFAESIETVASNLKEVKPTFLTTVPKLMETVKKRIYANMDREKESKKKIFNWAVGIGSKYIRAKQVGKVPMVLKSQYKLADKLVFSKIRQKIGVEKINFVSGGAALSPAVEEFFFAIGYTVIAGYGLTESSPVVTVARYDNFEIGTVGSALDSVEIKIANDGEILVRGPNVMKGYWNDPEATRTAIDDDGWLYTGDIGVLTERNNLKITDRKKDLIVSSGGKNIAPQMIENILSLSPYIERCIIIGDNREYLTALITPDFEQIKAMAENFGINYHNLTELISNEKIVMAIKQDIDRLQKDLAKYERVRRFKLLSEPFSIENGTLTPKLSIKRHVVERKYSDLIDQMYDRM